MPTTQHYVYIMTNRHGTLYTGMTHDLWKRVQEHRDGLCEFTARYRITKLVYYEVHYNRSYALERERQIKGWKRWRKLELIRRVNPAMRDLMYVCGRLGVVPRVTLAVGPVVNRPAERRSDDRFFAGARLRRGWAQEGFSATPRHAIIDLWNH